MNGKNGKDNPIFEFSEKSERSLIFGARGEKIVKEMMILLGWITALLIVANACWVTTLPTRDYFLIKAVNRVFERSGDPRRLKEASSGSTGGASGSFLMGSWYAMTEAQGKGKGVFIFVFIGEGTFFPCAAVMTEEGKVEEFIPLNKQGERMMKLISPGILKIYARRIERAEK
jgi:hypothetical protein